MVMSLGMFISLDGYTTRWLCPWYVYTIRWLCPLAITSDKHYIYYGVYDIVGFDKIKIVT